VSPAPRDLDHANQLFETSRTLEWIGERAASNGELASTYGQQLDPLLNEVQRLIAGTETGVDTRIAVVARNAQLKLAAARAALMEAAGDARQASAQALKDSRLPPRSSGERSR
jgi:hypothetical protein